MIKPRVDELLVLIAKNRLSLLASLSSLPGRFCDKSKTQCFENCLSERVLLVMNRCDVYITSHFKRDLNNSKSICSIVRRG